jgi:hypothetical protein
LKLKDFQKFFQVKKVMCRYGEREREREREGYIISYRALSEADTDGTKD